MLKIKVEGQPNQIQPFLYDLEQRTHIDFLYKEVNEKRDHNAKALCYIHHNPNRRVCTIQMITANGETIQIPIMDLIHVQLEEGKTLLVGKVFDVFA